MNLIIIGNGFDLYHEIPSSYRHFECYVKKYYKNLYNDLNSLFADTDLLWSDFESALGEPDFDTIRLDAENCIDYEKSDRTQPDYDTYPCKIKENLDLIAELIKCFKCWVIKLEKYIDLIDSGRVTFSNENVFINFNYTSLLEKVYNIQEDNILYIHNKASRDNNIIVGHNNKNKVSSNTNINEIYNLGMQAEEYENNYLQKTLKPIEKIIIRNQDYFKRLNQIDKVYILGHSLSEIDKRYFEEVKKYINDDSKWIVSYHNENKKCEYKLFLYNLGIKIDNIKLEKINNIKF